MTNLPPGPVQCAGCSVCGGQHHTGTSPGACAQRSLSTGRRGLRKSSVIMMMMML